MQQAEMHGDRSGRQGRFTVGDEVFYVEEGETLIMPKDIPHAVYGEERFKMQLTVSF